MGLGMTYALDLDTAVGGSFAYKNSNGGKENLDHTSSIVISEPLLEKSHVMH